MIRLLRLLCPALFLSLLPVPLLAQDRQDYDALMSALARATDPMEAKGLVPQIWDHWLTAPDEAAQQVLDAALDRRRVADFLGALVHLDKLIHAYPDYAEGWNQRATVYFLIGDFEASLADVAETLAREPRHFGALSGRAVIYYQQGNLPLAQIAIREALKVHPFLSERALLDIPTGDDI